MNFFQHKNTFRENLGSMTVNAKCPPSGQQVLNYKQARFVVWRICWTVFRRSIMFCMVRAIFHSSMNGVSLAIDLEWCHEDGLINEMFGV